MDLYHAPRSRRQVQGPRLGRCVVPDSEGGEKGSEACEPCKLYHSSR